MHDVDTAGLPFPNHHFDCTLCTHVLEHVYDVFGLVNELSRTLKPGGTLLLAVPNIAFVRHIISLLRDRVPRTGANEIPFSEQQGWDGQHLHYFTRREVVWLLNKYNINVDKTLNVGKWQMLKTVLPRLLCSGIVVIGTKSPNI